MITTYVRYGVVSNTDNDDAAIHHCPYTSRDDAEKTRRYLDKHGLPDAMPYRVVEVHITIPKEEPYTDQPS